MFLEWPGTTEGIDSFIELRSLGVEGELRGCV